jgi:hypothetical protein
MQTPAVSVPKTDEEIISRTFPDQEKKKGREREMREGEREKERRKERKTEILEKTHVLLQKWQGMSNCYLY